MLTLMRALAHATLFAGFLLWFVPAAILAMAGSRAPRDFGLSQVLGILVGIIGLGLAVSGVLAFATVGQGTPAPFDPPRRLMIRGPYRLIRNPMYLGAGLWVLGLAMFYRSPWLLLYAAVFMAIAHAFVLLHEEPALHRMFGDEYRGYCRRVRRWSPASS